MLTLVLAPVLTTTPLLNALLATAAEATSSNIDAAVVGLGVAAIGVIVTALLVLKSRFELMIAENTRRIKEVSKDADSKVAVAATQARAATQTATSVDNKLSDVLGLAQEAAKTSKAQTDAFLDALKGYAEQASYYQNTIRYLMDRNSSLQTTLDGRVAQFEKELREERQAREELEGKYGELNDKYEESERKYAAREQAWSTAWDGMVMVIAALPDGETIKQKLPPRPNGFDGHSTRRTK